MNWTEYEYRCKNYNSRLFNDLSAIQKGIDNYLFIKIIAYDCSDPQKCVALMKPHKARHTSLCVPEQQESFYTMPIPVG